MSASRPGNMRGPWLKSPLSLLLLLLLLLLSTRTGKVSCQEEEGEVTDVELEEEIAEADPEIEGDGDPTTPVPDATLAPDPSPTDDASLDPANGDEDKHGSGDEGEKRSRNFDIYGEIAETSTMYPVLTISPDEEPGLSLIIILIPVVLVVLIIGMIVCGIFINRRWNQKVRNQELGKEDPYLDGSSTEKVPMPMFEEDVPSVLELEMEELDQWMQKDGDSAEDSKHA